MTDHDRILHVAKSISDETRQGLKSVFEETTRLAKLLEDAKAASKMSQGDLDLSPEEVLYFWTFEAIERGLLDENELESMDFREMLLALEEKRDAWITGGVVGMMKASDTEMDQGN